MSEERRGAQKIKHTAFTLDRDRALYFITSVLESRMTD